MKKHEDNLLHIDETNWLLKTMFNAFVLFDSVFDENGKFISYRFVFINDAYEKITGVKNEEVKGKTVHEVWPDTEQSWIEKYGHVAVTGETLEFDNYHDPTKKLYHCIVYRPWESKNRFCVIFDDITEKKMAEREIAQQHNNLISLIENSSDLIWSVDADYKLLTANSNFLNFMKPVFNRIIKPGDLVISKDLLPEELYRKWKKFYDKALAGNKFIETFKTSFQRDREFYFEFRYNPILDENTEVTGVSIIGRDITEAKHYESVLIESENKIRSITEQMSNMIYLTDKKGIITYISPASENIFGYKSEEMEGRAFVEFLAEEDVPKAMQKFQAAISSGQSSKNLELLMRHKNGTAFHGEVSGKLYFHGDQHGTIGVIRDISDRRKTENELIMAKKTAEKYLELAGSIILSLNTKGEISLINQAGIDILEYSKKEELLGKNWFETFIPLNLVDEKKEAFHKALSGQLNIVDHYEAEIITKTGKVKTVLWHNTAIRDENNQITSLLSSGQDITERKQAELAIRENSDKLQSLFDNMSSGFAYHKIILDNSGKPVDYEFLEINKAFEEMTGLKAENILGKRVSLVLPGMEKDSTDWIGVYGKVALTGESVHFGNYSIGLNKWYSVSAYSPAKGYFAAIFEDITVQKMIEHELRDSEILYREIFESSKDGYMTLEGPDWKFVSANKAVIELFRLNNREEFLNMAPWQLSPPRQPDGRDSEEKAREMIEIAIEKGSNFFEWIHQRSNGENFYATVLLNRIDLENRSFVLAVVRDVSETKISRLQLEESENRYRSLFENSTDPNLIIIAETFADCNPATLNFMGYKNKDEIVGKKPWDVSPEYQPDGQLSQEKAKKVISQASEKGYARFEWLHLNAKNKEIWVDVALTFIKVKGEDIIYTVWRDITKRKEVELALEENRKRLELTLTGANLGLWDINFKTNIAYRSKEWSSMLGYHPDEIPNTNESWLQLIHPEDIDDVIFVRKNHENLKDEFFHSEQRLKCKNGSYKWILNWGQIVERDEDGKPVRAVGIHMDIDERKKAEVALRNSEDLNRTVIESSPIGISVRDTNGTLLLYNKAWQKLWGLTDAEISAYKKPREKLLFNQKDKYLGESVNEIKRVYTKGGSYEIPELKLKEIHKNKAEWISQYFYAIMNENDQVDRVVILTNDITQRKNAQLEIIQYRDHLEELVKERTSELEKKNIDLKKYNKLFTGREFRIKELRNKLAELEAKLKDHD